jgi:hypothetical protein
MRSISCCQEREQRVREAEARADAQKQSVDAEAAELAIRERALAEMQQGLAVRQVLMGRRRMLWCMLFIGICWCGGGCDDELLLKWRCRLRDVCR